MKRASAADDDFLYVCICDQIRVWEAGQSEPKVVVNSGDVLPLAAAGWRDGRGLVYGSEDGALTIW